MAMTVGELINRLKLVPKECHVQAAVPEAGTRTVKMLGRCHHHGRDEEHVDPAQPVEIFAGDKPMKVQDLVRRLHKFPAESLVRVALDNGDHHRMLDIDVVGFGADGDPPPVEMTTERLDSVENGGSAVVRLNNINPDEKGDWTYTAGGVRRRIEEVELETRPKE
jgi:hypothetical protein